MANFNELMDGWSYGQQSNIVTPNTTASRVGQFGRPRSRYNPANNEFRWLQLVKHRVFARGAGRSRKNGRGSYAAAGGRTHDG